MKTAIYPEQPFWFEGENPLGHLIFVFLHKMFCGQGFPLDKRANVSYYI